MLSPIDARFAVVATGARTALGLNAEQTAFLYRTGAAGMAEAPLLAAGNSFGACFDPTLPPDLLGEERVATLAIAPLEEVLQALLPVHERSPLTVELVLCLDPVHAERGANGTIAQRLSRLCHAKIPISRVSVVSRGEGGGGAALAMACDAIERGHAPMAILGGVHSDLDRQVIARLVAERRLLTNDNLDALTPGETAAFVAICSAKSLPRLGLPPLAAIGACASTMEPARYDNDVPMAIARGLTHAMHQASAPLLSAKLRAGWIMTDITHETWRLLEYQSVSVRAKDVFGEPCFIDCPAHRLGSLGAAAIPYFMLHAAEAWRGGFAPHPLALAFAGSDTGERTALLMAQA